MKEELYITFHSEDDIRHFVDTCNEFDDAIDIRIQKMAMDAKSLLGMLLMKTEEPLEIEYACYDDGKIRRKSRTGYGKAGSR